MRTKLRFDGMLTIGGLALLAVAFVLFVLLPGRRQVTALHREIAAAEQQIKEVPLKVAELEALKADVEKRKTYLKQTDTSVPTDANVGGLLQTVSNVASETRLNVTRLEPLAAVDRETFHIHPFRIGFRADYRTTARFLSRLEQLSRTVAFEGITLKSEFGGSEGIAEAEVGFSVYAVRGEKAEFAEKVGNAGEGSGR